MCNIFKQIGFDDIVVVDKYKSQITDKLQSQKIKVVIWDGKYNFSPSDVIIYSDAVIQSKDFQKIKNNRKFSYFEFLWEISKWFKTIAIAWTHWKTSTTSMFLYLGKNFLNDLQLWIVWGFVPDLDWQNYFIWEKKEDIKLIFEKILSPKWARPSHLFKKYYFVVEADEFNKHFLMLDPYISLICKVDYDHKDVYSTYEDYLNAFKLFLLKTCCKSFTIDEDFYLKFYKKFDLELVKKKKIKFKYVFGEHMEKNASLVIESMKHLTNLPEDEFLNEIENFKWIRRRQEYLWKLWKMKVYSDYAHHPVEIMATYEAFKKKFDKIWVVFQPHQLFRFVSYEKDFQSALSKIENLIVYDIYSVREQKLLKQLWEKEWKIWTDQTTEKEVIKTIWEKIAKKSWWIYIDNFDNLIEFLNDKNWVLLIMSAGDLDYKIRNLVNRS